MKISLLDRHIGIKEILQIKVSNLSFEDRCLVYYFLEDFPQAVSDVNGVKLDAVPEHTPGEILKNADPLFITISTKGFEVLLSRWYGL